MASEKQPSRNFARKLSWTARENFVQKHNLKHKKGPFGPFCNSLRVKRCLAC
jgi:hypothetical protein